MWTLCKWLYIFIYNLTWKLVVIVRDLWKLSKCFAIFFVWNVTTNKGLILICMKAIRYKLPQYCAMFWATIAIFSGWPLQSFHVHVMWKWILYCNKKTWCKIGQTTLYPYMYFTLLFLLLEPMRILFAALLSWYFSELCTGHIVISIDRNMSLQARYMYMFECSPFYLGGIFTNVMYMYVPVKWGQQIVN